MPSILRAADYLVPDNAENVEPGNFAYAPNRERLVMRLFGETPRYGEADIRALYAEIDDEDPLAVYDYCRRRGVDVLDDSGTPVPPWRDIAVMLRARDRGLLPGAA